MTELDKNTKNYLRMFSEPEFTEDRFVRLFLRLLYKNRVYCLDEVELSRKLYYYYKNPEFKELFRDIAKDRYRDAVDIHHGMASEKYFAGNVIPVHNSCTKICLFYGENSDLPIYTKGLSEAEISLMEKIAQDFGIRSRIELTNKYRMNIYGTDPNQCYYLVNGEYWINNLNSELLTDGNIKTITRDDTKGKEHLIYPNPIYPYNSVQLKNAQSICVELENASYAVQQGLEDGLIQNLEIYTTCLEPLKLEQIREIANKKQEEDNFLISEKPYVRKIDLK